VYRHRGDTVFEKFDASTFVVIGSQNDRSVRFDRDRVHPPRYGQTSLYQNFTVTNGVFPRLGFAYSVIQPQH
jgi:hypothetical protein|tara:strand:- start:207 stop:422 length:216 start_codon:yes stop_codon:yes gene_type:complete